MEPACQTKQLHGAWIEYKREVIGDTSRSNYFINTKDITNKTYYHFLTDSTFLLNDTLHKNYYLISNDTLNTINLNHGDLDILPAETKYLISFKNKNEMILRDVCQKEVFGYVSYFKRTVRPKKPKAVKQKIVNEPPKFPGREDSLKKFLQKNINSNLISDKKNLDLNNVHLQLSIDESGKIYDARILNHPLKIFAQEAIRVVKLMPNWNPGIDWQIDSENIDATPKKVKSTVSITISFDK